MLAHGVVIVGSAIDEALAKALPCFLERNTGGEFSCDRPDATDKRVACANCKRRPAVRAAILELLEPLRGLNWRTAIEHTSECWQRLDRDCLCNYADRLVALDALIAEVNRG